MATTFRVGVPSEIGSLDGAQFLTWVIERAGEAVGYLVLTLSSSQQQTTAAYISGLYVDPEARGQGIGAKALQFAGDIGRTFGFRVYSRGVADEDKRLVFGRLSPTEGQEATRPATRRIVSSTG